MRVYCSESAVLFMNAFLNNRGRIQAKRTNPPSSHPPLQARLETNPPRSLSLPGLLVSTPSLSLCNPTAIMSASPTPVSGTMRLGRFSNDFSSWSSFSSLSIALATSTGIVYSLASPFSRTDCFSSSTSSYMLFRLASCSSVNGSWLNRQLSPLVQLWVMW